MLVADKMRDALAMCHSLTLFVLLAVPAFPSLQWMP